jgi:NADPH:quinone reductase-like Zn-dependent oxidoreductase
MLTGEVRAHHGRILEAVAAIVDAGALRPRVAPARFGLADAEAAHALVASGRAGGKVVVEIA